MLLCFQAIPGLGGMPRRARAVGGGAGSRDDKLRLLVDLLGGLGLRFLAAHGGVPVIVRLNRLLPECVQRCQESASTVVDIALTTKSVADIRKLDKTCRTGNSDAKCMAASKVMFATEYEEIAACRILLEKAIEALYAMTELMLTSQFGDNDSGSIAWTSFGERCVDAVDGAAEGRGRRMAAPGGGGALGGGA